MCLFLRTNILRSIYIGSIQIELTTLPLEVHPQKKPGQQMQMRKVSQVLQTIKILFKKKLLVISTLHLLVHFNLDEYPFLLLVEYLSLLTIFFGMKRCATFFD